MFRFLVFGFRFVSVFGLFTITMWLLVFMLLVTVGIVAIRRFFVSVRIMLAVFVLLGILVSISVIQRADSGWLSPSVFFDVIVFGWDGIVTVFDIQVLFFVLFLSIGILTNFFDGRINVAVIVLGSVVLFFVSVGIAITMLLVSAISWLFVTVGIVAIGWLVTVGIMAIGWLVSVVVSTIRWLFVTVRIVAIGWLVSVVVSTIRWLFVTVGIVAIGWLVYVVVSTIRWLFVTIGI